MPETRLEKKAKKAVKKTSERSRTDHIKDELDGPISTQERVPTTSQWLGEDLFCEEDSPPDDYNFSTSYTVQPGDSLSSIAAKLLGDANRWDDIYQLNKHLISNPNQIQSGWVLTVPQSMSVSTLTTTPPPTQTTSTTSESTSEETSDEGTDLKVGFNLSSQFASFAEKSTKLQYDAHLFIEMTQNEMRAEGVWSEEYINQWGSNARKEVDDKFVQFLSDLDAQAESPEITGQSLKLKGLSGVFRIAGIAALAFEIVNGVYTVTKADPAERVKVAVGQIGGILGGIAGGAAGAYAGGVAGASVGAHYGAAAGAIIGGTAGAIGGAIGGEKAAMLIWEKVAPAEDTGVEFELKT